MTDDYQAVGGFDGGYVPCPDLSAALPPTDDNGYALEGHDEGYVAVGEAAASDPSTVDDGFAVNGHDEGYVANPCAGTGLTCAVFDDFNRVVDPALPTPPPFVLYPGLRTASGGSVWNGTSTKAINGGGCDGSVFFVNWASNFDDTVTHLGGGRDPWDAPVVTMTFRFRVNFVDPAATIFDMSLGPNTVGVVVTNNGYGRLEINGDSASKYVKNDWVDTQWYLCDWQINVTTGFMLARVYPDGTVAPAWQVTLAYAGGRLSADDFTMLLDTANSATTGWRAEIDYITFCSQTCSIVDTFSRTVAGGWGTADTGQAWVLNTSAGPGATPGLTFSVDGSQAVCSCTNAAIEEGSADIVTGMVTLDGRFQVTSWTGPTNDQVYITFTSPGDLSNYNVTLQLGAPLLIRLGAHNAGASTNAFTGGAWNVHVQIDALGIRASAWAVGGGEPAGWDVDLPGDTSPATPLAFCVETDGMSTGGVIKLDNVLITGPC